MTTVLVPLDGSEFAARALPTAAAIARASGGAIELVQIVPSHPFPQSEVDAARRSAVLAARKALGDAASPLRTDGLRVTVHVETGQPAAGIVAAATDLRADLIVMSTHGRGGLGRWYYGSVADEVLRSSPVPVLIVHATARIVPPAASGSRVVVPLDGSAFGEVAIEQAVDLARTLAADVVLLRVVEPVAVATYGDPYAAYVQLDGVLDVKAAAAEARTYLASVAARFQGSGVQLGERVEIGDPATVVASVAAEVVGSVIAMATHGRTGLARFALGSTATAVLQHATVPVLLVRPGQLVHAPPLAVPAAAASAGNGKHPTMAAMTVELSSGDVEMVRYGLDLLAGTVDRDRAAMAAIQDLGDRLDSAARTSQEPVGGGVR